MTILTCPACAASGTRCPGGTTLVEDAAGGDH
jgi:hypothetical protein